MSAASSSARNAGNGTERRSCDLGVDQTNLPPDLGDGPANVHPAAQHVEVAHPQRRHLAPPQAGVGQESDHGGVAADRFGEQLDLSWVR